MNTVETSLLSNDVVAIDRLGQVYLALKQELSKAMSAETTFSSNSLYASLLDRINY